MEKCELKAYDTRPTKVEVADKSKVTVTQAVITNVKLKQVPNAEFKPIFHVMPNLGTDSVLRMDFLVDNGCLLNFKTNYMIIDDKELTMSSFENREHRKHPDNVLFDKNKSYSLEIEKYQIENLENQPQKGESLYLEQDKKPETDLGNFLNIYNNKQKKLGKIKGFKHRINLIDKNKTIQCKPYNLPISVKAQVYTKLDQLENLGIIAQTESNYCSPCFPITKKNDQTKLIVDYCLLNNNTQKEQHSIPRLYDSLHNLRTANIVRDRREARIL